MYIARFLIRRQTNVIESKLVSRIERNRFDDGSAAEAILTCLN
jgi:hypothetical protein